DLAGAEPARGARPTRARRPHAPSSGGGAQAMTFPPSLLRLRVRTPEHAWPTLWLPLFVVWALLFLLLVPLALVVLLVAIVLDPRQTVRAFELVGALFAVVCGLRGVRVDVGDGRAQVLISFY